MKYDLLIYDSESLVNAFDGRHNVIRLNEFLLPRQKASQPFFWVMMSLSVCFLTRRIDPWQQVNGTTG